MDVNLVLAKRVNDKLVDLVAFYLLVFDKVVVLDMHLVTLVNLNFPDIDLAVTVTHIQQVLIVESESIGVLLLDHVLDVLVLPVLLLCLLLRGKVVQSVWV